jgi:hypothetical protein
MHSDEHDDAIERGHEPITLSVGAVTKGFSVLYGTMLIALLLMGGLVLLLRRIDGGEETVDAPTQSAETAAEVPALDSDQAGSLRALRERERNVLTEYAWVDREAGIARIPIKRAMEIVSQSSRLSTQPTNDDKVKP